MYTYAVMKTSGSSIGFLFKNSYCVHLGDADVLGRWKIGIALFKIFGSSLLYIVASERKYRKESNVSLCGLLLIDDS